MLVVTLPGSNQHLLRHPQNVVVPFGFQIHHDARRTALDRLQPDMTVTLDHPVLGTIPVIRGCIVLRDFDREVHAPA